MTVQPSTSFWINLKDGFLEKTNYRIIESNFKNLVFGDLDQCVRGPRRIWNDQIASSNCGGTGNEKRVSSYWVEKGRIKQVNFFPLTPPPPKKESTKFIHLHSPFFWTEQMLSSASMVDKEWRTRILKY